MLWALTCDANRKRSPPKRARNSTYSRSACTRRPRLTRSRPVEHQNLGPGRSNRRLKTTFLFPRTRNRDPRFRSDAQFLLARGVEGASKGVETDAGYAGKEEDGRGGVLSEVGLYEECVPKGVLCTQGSEAGLVLFLWEGFQDLILGRVLTRLLVVDGYLGAFQTRSGVINGVSLMVCWHRSTQIASSQYP